MNDNNDIIEFEDLFKEDIKHRNEPPRPENKKNYLLAISSYILIMFFLNAILLAIVMQIPSAQKTFSKAEILLENIAADVSGVTLMDEASFTMYKDDYKGYVTSLGVYDGYHVVYNSSNTYIENLLLEKNEEQETTGINEELLLSIYDGSDSQLNFWDQDQTLKIVRYQTDDQLLPTFFLVSDYKVIDYTGTTLTAFYQSLYQFIIYAILLVVLYRLLKTELVYDFNQFKLIKNQWFVVIAVGYLYVLLGNIASNYISKFLSGLFKTPIAESINQMTIVRMLHSNGVIFIVLSAVIIGPIVEELIFRKSIFGLIKNPKVALLVSSVVFGAIHLTGEASITTALINGVSYFTMGAIFGYIYLKNNKNIMAPIAVHILVNLISVVASIFLF